MYSRDPDNRFIDKDCWSDKIEARSLEFDKRILASAQENTARVSDPSFLINLAREIVAARSAELTRCYKNLVWALPGFRKKRVLGVIKNFSEVCVVLVVKEKVQVDSLETSAVLPSYFLTFAEWQGERKPFFIPTDVQDPQHYFSVFPNAPSAVWLGQVGYPSEIGSFCCIVKIVTPNDSWLCILGALHVFSPFERTEDESGLCEIFPISAKGELLSFPGLAVTSTWRGALYDDENPEHCSLDVQLAQVTFGGESALRKRVGLRHFNKRLPYVTSLDELMSLGLNFLLLAPNNNPKVMRRKNVELQLSAIPDNTIGIPYFFIASGREYSKEVFHEELLKFDSSDPTNVPFRGDSGSAIVFEHEDKTMTFVALHIAGDELGASWGIPAWSCLDINNWKEFPAEAVLKLEDA